MMIICELNVFRISLYYYFAIKRPMKVICLEDAAFYTLVEEVVTRLKEKNSLC
jgi:hypothetical protein